MSDDGLMLDVFPDQETIRVPWDAIRSYAPSQRMAHISEYSYMVPGDDGFIDVRDWGHIRLINFKAGRKNSAFHDYFIQTSERSDDIPTFNQALASIKAHCEARWNEEKAEKERAEKEKAEGERMEKEKAEQERIDTERQHASSTLNDGSSSETSATPIARLPELKPLSEMDEVSILEEYERNKTEIVTLTTEHPSLQALAEELDKVLNEREVVVHEIHRRRQEVPKKQYPEGNRLGDLNKKATFLFNRMNDLEKALEPLATQRARLQRLLKRQAEIEQL